MKQKSLYSKKNALVGDLIQFEKNESLFFGKVMALRENSVIVEVTLSDAAKLEIENERTVVNHKNYKIKERCSNPPSPSYSYIDSLWVSQK